jgi:putative hydrolase of the HAD superfamily
MALLSLLFIIVEHPVHLQAKEQNPITVIVFDFSGVIAKLEKKELANFVAQSLQIPQAEAWHALKKLKKDLQQENTEEDFWIAYANSEGIRLPEQWVDKLNEARIHALKEIPGMVNLVKDLQRQGYQTALLSNASERPTALRRSSSYYQLFHPVLFSSEIGARKPHRKAYQILLDHLDVSPEAVLFIDNRLKNVKEARSLGIDGIRFKNRDKLIRQLEKRGIKVTNL